MNAVAAIVHCLEPTDSHSSAQSSAQLPLEQTSPSPQARGEPHSRQGSMSESPQCFTASPSHSLAPAKVHSSWHSCEQLPPEQLSPASQAATSDHSRQPSPLVSPQTLKPLPSQVFAPSTVHSSSQVAAQKPSVQVRSEPQGEAVPHSRQPSASLLPQTWNASPWHFLAPKVVHSSSQVAEQVPAEQVSPAAQGTTVPYSRQPSSS